MTPYYDADGITIYCGDCREVLPHVTGDVLVTDPPYGVGLGTQQGRGGGHGMKIAAYDSYDDTYESFTQIVVPGLNAALDIVTRAAVFTGPHIHEQRKPDAIGGVFCPAGAGRHCWGFKTFLPVLLYGTAPDLNRGAKPNVIRSSETPNRRGNDHPTPKPIGWMTWLVDLASLPGETVLDPFMGSGTTLVAAKQLGRRAIGIELSERYCEIAARRLSQGVLALNLP